MDRRLRIRVTVNGHVEHAEVQVRTLLSDFLRYHLGLTGTHVGCEHGVCGSCTVLMREEGEEGWAAVRSCLLLAVQVDGAELLTVEGLAPGSNRMHSIQEAFRKEHGLQCGYCTPGILMTLVPFLQENPNPDETSIRVVLSGNLCRCTGYQNIIKAVRLAAELMTAPQGDSREG